MLDADADADYAMRADDITLIIDAAFRCLFVSHADALMMIMPMPLLLIIY